MICAFSAEDVISNQHPDELEDPSEALLDRAAEWLSLNESGLEDAMTKLSL